VHRAEANPTFYADLISPQSLNKYQYCLQNPLKFIDPDGHQEMALDPEWQKAQNDTVRAIASALTEYGKGWVKSGLNVVIGMSNAGSRVLGKSEAEYYQPSNEIQSRAMGSVDLVITGAALAGGKMPANVVAAEAKQTTSVISILSKITDGTAQAREAVKAIKQPGTHATINVGGKEVIPTRQVAEKLIASAGGTIERIEKAHKGKGHPYPHINYTTADGKKATVQVESVGKQFYREKQKFPQ
jgi:hypothetical protein